MNYNPEEQEGHLVLDLLDAMQNRQEFDNVVSVLIEWGLIGAGLGAIAPEMWKEGKE